MVMKFGKILCSMFLFAILAMTVHKTQSVVISAQVTNQQKRDGYVIQPKGVSTVMDLPT